MASAVSFFRTWLGRMGLDGVEDSTVRQYSTHGNGRTREGRAGQGKAITVTQHSKSRVSYRLSDRGVGV